MALTKKRKESKKKLPPVKRKMPIKLVDPQKDWYICKVGKKIIPSPAEVMIQLILKDMGIEFFSEVSFRGFGGRCQPYRFDFWIPSRNMIIEYDGAQHLTNRKVKANDLIKNNFCKYNKIRLHRLNKIHYSNLDLALKNILKK